MIPTRRNFAGNNVKTIYNWNAGLRPNPTFRMAYIQNSPGTLYAAHKPEGVEFTL